MKTSFHLIVGSLSLVLMLGSCTTTRVATWDRNEGLPSYSTQLPDRPYEEIAIIQTVGGVFHTPQHLLNGLQKKAVKLEADALIQVRYDFQFTWPVATATAIRYTSVQ
jgi:hypothetical protein